MKIESIIPRTVLADPAGMESPGARSAIAAQASPKYSRQEPQPHKPLQEESPSSDEIRQNIAALNEQLESTSRSIRFSIDEGSKEIVVKVVDKHTGDVVMQIPPEELLRLRERMNEMSGPLMEKQV